MERHNYIKLVIILSILLSNIACNNTSSNDFDKLIEDHYESCKSLDSCTIDLKTLPFKWDKFYIFSENHFPEVLDKEGISLVLGTKYNKSIDPNDRLIVFLYEGKVVRDIINRYEKENYIDRKPLLVDFYIDTKAPLYFSNYNSKFTIKKFNNNYTLYWINDK